MNGQNEPDTGMKRARRVLHLAESPYLGGITSHILTVARAFEGHSDYRIVVACLTGKRADTALLEQARMQGTNVHVLDVYRTFDRGVMRRLRDFVAAQQIDLVHTHNYRATLVAGLARLPVPVVNTCHGRLVRPTARLQLWQWLELRAMSRHRAVIACSVSVRDWLVSQGVPAARIGVVYNACDGPVAAPFRGRDGAGVALYLGRMANGKGGDDLLRALAGSGWRGVFVGDGPSRKEWEALAGQLGVAAEFRGFQGDPSEALREADVVVLPSHMEAMPMAVLEAAAWGLPVVATRVGGVPEAVVDGETGILVDPGDVTGLRNALVRMTDGALRERMGMAARDRWDRMFRPEVLVAGLVGVYEGVLG